MAEPTNTPMPPGTPVPGSPRTGSPASAGNQATTPAAAQPKLKPSVLLIGSLSHIAESKTLQKFQTDFTIIETTPHERERAAFIQALKDRKWGDFAAVLRPVHDSDDKKTGQSRPPPGWEMGPWDEDIVGLLPESMRAFASGSHEEGATVHHGIFDGVDGKALGRRAIAYFCHGVAVPQHKRYQAVDELLTGKITTELLGSKVWKPWPNNAEFLTVLPGWMI